MQERWGQGQGVTSKRGRPRDRASARAHADKEDGGPRREPEEAPGDRIAASGAVPVGGGRQRARLLAHDHEPPGRREEATGTNRLQPHAVAGKGAELTRSPAPPGPLLRRAPRPRPLRALAPAAAGGEKAGRRSGCSASQPRPRRGLSLPAPSPGVRFSRFLHSQGT